MKIESTGCKALALAALIALPGIAPAQEMVNAEAYRAALQDKFANPGTMVSDRGEILFKAPRGPKNVSLEKCDFGLGAGKLAGAYAQLPRYFKDSDMVEDLESRLVTCMVKLQGFTHQPKSPRRFLVTRHQEREQH
jgi:sulfur-oxidizing protein SoxA